MKQLITKVIGSSDQYSFEQRLYHGICLIASMGSFGIALFNLIVTQLPFDTLISFIISALGGILYYLSRVKKRNFFLSFYLAITLMLSVGFFKDFGIYSTIPYFLIVNFILILTYSPVKWHIKIAIFQFTLLSIILFIGYNFPSLINNPYKTQKNLYSDLMLGIMFTAFLCFISIYFLRKSYDNERELNQHQKELLEKANEQKSMFFINLSHEIKTPLTLIENYLEKYIMAKGEDKELTVMRQNIQKMRKDILNYLNFENIERGNLSYDEKDAIHLSGLLDEKIKLFMPYAENKKVELTFQIQPEVYASANFMGMDQVLNNLIENAVKYTPEHERIYIQLKVEDDNAEITFQNTGTTIPFNQIPHLFEPFYQLSHEKLNAQGIGMGLHIVKKILDNMGGKIDVRSNPEEGVVFTVKIPLNTSHELNINENRDTASKPVLQAPDVKATDSEYNTQNPSLLVVEDHNDLLRYLVDELSGNYNVFVAHNGAAAMDRLGQIPLPDVIISDIMMDTMDGYQLLENTLADERFAHIPFIFLTARNNPLEKAESFEKGAFDFITKPFSIDELKTKIRAIIKQKEIISEAAVREIKKQFAKTGFTKNPDDTFNHNLLFYKVTSREKDVILCIRKGLKYEEISNQLHISEHTVIRHVQNIYKKIGVASKIELLQKMFEIDQSHENNSANHS